MDLPRGGLLALTVAAVLVLAGAAVWRADSGARLACQILPGGMVPPFASRGPGCTLKAYDRVIASRVAGEIGPAPDAALQRRARGHRSLELLVERGGRRSWVQVPFETPARGRLLVGFTAGALVTVLVMAIALLIRRGSAHPAAVPFVRFYACVSVVLACAVPGLHHGALVLPGVLAGAFVPATLMHLALTFPRTRKVPGGRRSVLAVVYASAAALALVSVLSLERAPILWAWSHRATLGLTLAAWVLLVVGCLAASLWPGSLLERARARVLLAGSAAVPAFSVIAGLWFGAALPGGSQALAVLTVAALPMPIGYAISRHRLFDLSLDLRRAVAYLVYVAASAGGIAGLVALAQLLGAPLPLGDPLALYAAALGGFALADPLRARLRGALDRWMAPGVPRMMALGEAHTRRVGALLEADACAALLCRTVSAGVEARGASVFVRDEGDDLQLAAAWGDGAPVRIAAGTLALESAAGRVLCLSDAEATPQTARHRLREMGAEVVVPLRGGGRGIGVLLVTPSRRGTPYTTPQLRFMETLGRSSATAIHNAHLARDLIAAERLATRGRLGAELIHDLGKPLGVVETLARRLPARFGDPGRLARDARTIAELAGEARALLRDFLGEIRRSAAGDVPSLVDRAVRHAEAARGSGRVCARLEADLPPLDRCGEKVVRALANLIDNALLASERGDIVEVVVTRSGDALDFVVLDRGCGMSEAQMQRAFEPFYTTRPSQGSGLGLTACRDLAESLGGGVWLESRTGAGTAARLRVPLSR